MEIELVGRKTRRRDNNDEVDGEIDDVHIAVKGRWTVLNSRVEIIVGVNAYTE